MKIRDIMDEALTVPEDATLEHVALLMTRKRVDAVSVVGADGRLRGTVSVSEFVAKPAPVPFSMVRLPQLFGRWLPKHGVEHVYRDARKLTAAEVMSPAVATVTEEEPVEEVLRRMADEGVEMLSVVRGGTPSAPSPGTTCCG